MRTTMLRRAPVLLGLLALSAFAAAAVPDPGAGEDRVTPRTTGVLLLPPTDTEPWSSSVLAQRQFVVRRRCQYELLTREFEVYGEALAVQAAQRPPGIDLANPAGRTAATLDDLATRTGAAWVVSVEVQEVAEDASPAMTGDRFHCHCRIELKVWDARHHRWRFNGPVVGHDQRGSSSPVFLFMEAIDEAAKGALLRVIGSHPAVVTIDDVNRVTDYLAGATAPILGRAGQHLAIPALRSP